MINDEKVHQTTGDFTIKLIRFTDPNGDRSWRAIISSDHDKTVTQIQGQQFASSAPVLAGISDALHKASFLIASKYTKLCS